ncbi:ARP2 3 complex 21 kDa subunit [Gloeopeniophorella convolvens]|nr:ARP2 3 complex 21 kDa subunit [Gloeopeniophorella convolvens]
MPAYHSALNEEPDVRQVGNLGIYPIKTRLRGPAPVLASNEQGDIVDETLDLFRANSLFRNFEIKGPGDRLLIILILFISDCLAKIGTSRAIPSQIEASKTLNTLAVDNFPIPGDANFPLNAHYSPPGSRADADYLRQYLVQVRQELAARLVEKLYADGSGKPSKWWMSFQKRRFMNRSLGS